MNHYTSYKSSSLQSSITAAARDTIRAHGPITTNFLPSLTKRVFGVIKNHINNYLQNTGCSRNKWLLIMKQNLSEEVRDDGVVEVKWSEMKSLINSAIERGYVIQDFEKLHAKEISKRV